MDRNEIYDICNKVNQGQSLEDICKNLNIMTEQMEELIKREGIKRSKILNIYYAEHQKEKIGELEKKKKCFNNGDIIEQLWQRRYRGIDVYNYEIGLEDEWADEPRERVKIDLNWELLQEIEDISEKEGTPVAWIIEKYLLQQLERNRETRLNVGSMTKGKRIYIDTMIEESVLKKCKKEVYNNIKDTRFMKFKAFTYCNKSFDIKIYIVNYLMNNGYTLEQIEELEKEEGYDLYENDYCSELTEAHFLTILYGQAKNCEEAKKVLEEEAKELNR